MIIHFNKRFLNKSECLMQMLKPEMFLCRIQKHNILFIVDLSDFGLFWACSSSTGWY